MPDYDIFQQVYQLCLASNMVRSCLGSPSELQDKLSNALPGVMDTYAGPGWSCVWGPAVWKNPKGTDQTPPDNVWFVAKNPSATLEDGSTGCIYVVAIAATAGDDFKSYDWTQENFGVNKAVDFNGWIQAGITNPPEDWRPVLGWLKPLTAKGTTNAVFTLANSPPVGGTQSLLDFLKNEDVPAGSKIVFTGQSLGGALSPTLALTLKQAGYLDKFASALVYGSAGATPGNAWFAKLFSKQFPPTGDRTTYRVWNLNLVNTYDVVPNAWCRVLSSPLRLGRINTIYGKLEGNLALLVGTGVVFLRNRAAVSGVNYTPLDHADFSGPAPVQPPQDLAGFTQQFALQHMAAYHNYVLGSLNTPPNLCPTTPQREAALASPVLACIQDSIQGRVPDVPDAPEEEAE